MTTDLSLTRLVELLNHRKLRLSLTGFLVLCSLIFIGLTIQALIMPAPQIAITEFDTKPKQQRFRWNWFSPLQEAVVDIEPQEEEELSEATIKAELLGVLITADDSYASIATASDPDGVYAVGDSIENGVILEQIDDYRVVISQRGNRQQIPLKSLDKTRSDDKRTLMQVEPSSNRSGFNLSGLVSATPIQLSAGGIGLKLGGLSGDLTDLADVREADIVVAVNGTAVSDIMSNPLLWQQFSKQTSMPITMLRDGKQIELSINAASLAEKILPQLGAGQIE